MCSPELTRGLCCICCGTLTEENTLYDDLNEGRGGVHKGKCAILAGIYNEVSAAEENRLTRLVERIRITKGNRELWMDAFREYYAFVDSIATEDHYDMSGPE